MELNNDKRRRRSEEKDRLSMLPDDVLLYILGRVGLTTAARTSALSTQWTRLPWLLPELSIDVEDFISDPHSKPIAANVIHDAMLTVTAATKSLFAKLRREFVVRKLQLQLYLINTFSWDIGSLVCDTIDRGLLRYLDLAILDDKDSCECSHSDMIKHAQDIDGFFSAYPSVLHCLTRLSLYNVSFVGLDINNILFDCCKQLKHLTLTNCDAGPRSLWKIDAQNSKLCVLELDLCFFEIIELISLPELERLYCALWISKDAPLSFGFVPSLEDLHLANCFDNDQHAFKLSELLNRVASLRILTLDFRGENIWVDAEIRQLTSAFSDPRKLSVLGIFIEFDLLWTITFLESAPSIKILHIEIWEHACPLDPDGAQQTYRRKRSSPQWELDFPGSKNLLLRDLQINGFRPLEQQLTFIRSIIKRAPNLQIVVLKEDGAEECTECKAMALNVPPSVSAWPAFPKKKDAQDMVTRKITDGTSFSGRVIFQC